MRPLNFVACFLVIGAYAQDIDPTLTFETASVRIAERPDPASPRAPREAGRFTRFNFPLAGLVVTAYRLQPYEYSGPSWMESARFDIAATVGGSASPEQQSVMLRNLLEERFGLKTHREKKEIPGYDLVVARGGPKFKMYEPGSPNGPTSAAGARSSVDADGFPVLPPAGGTVWGPTGKNGAVVGAMREHITMKAFARRLVSLTGRPVNDGTGLDGTYDLSMRWAGDVHSPDATDVSPGPSLFEALQSQLGLKLESRKVTVDLLIVDHAERVPTPN